MTARIGAMFAGAGGLERGIAAVLDAEPVWFAETDPAASRVLAAHWPEVPNLGDVTTVDWTRVEPVDVLTVGWPCQPWSQAGRRRGVLDERALWPEVARAVCELRPRLFVGENVAAIVAAGELERALGDLSTLGLDAEWGVLPASAVGAPHRRERLFLVAWPAADAAFAERRGAQPEHLAASLGRTAEPRERASAVAWGQYESAIRRWELILGRTAPPPTTTGARGAQVLSADFAEWLMGWPQGWTDVGLSRSERLRCIGNGVVPQQAAAALAHLLNVDEELAA